MKPSDCAIAFGIPTCRAGFEGRRLNGTSDYVRRFSGWHEYNARFARILNELESPLRGIGVALVQDATLSMFADLFDCHRVVILFSHWKEEDPAFPKGAIEFDDGLIDLFSVVDAVPTDYGGILDLCVCCPKSLPDTLRATRPRCHLKYLHHKARPDIWLYFYGKLFDQLSKAPMSYLDALVHTRTHFGGPKHKV